MFLPPNPSSSHLLTSHHIYWRKIGPRHFSAETLKWFVTWKGLKKPPTFPPTIISYNLQGPDIKSLGSLRPQDLHIIPYDIHTFKPLDFETMWTAKNAELAHHIIPIFLLVYKIPNPRLFVWKICMVAQKQPPSKNWWHGTLIDQKECLPWAYNGAGEATEPWGQSAVRRWWQWGRRQSGRGLRLASSTLPDQETHQEIQQWDPPTRLASSTLAKRLTSSLFSVLFLNSELAPNTALQVKYKFCFDVQICNTVDVDVVVIVSAVTFDWKCSMYMIITGMYYRFQLSTEQSRIWSHFT